jgi:hypothetical protein
MATVKNDRDNSSRPEGDQCDWFCGPDDVASWGRALLSINDRATVLINAATPEDRGTMPFRALLQWQIDSKPYAEIGFSLTNLFTWSGTLYPLLATNATIVHDLARRAEDGQGLVDAAAAAVGVPELGYPGSNADRPGPGDSPLVVALKLGAVAYIGFLIWESVTEK